MADSATPLDEFVRRFKETFRPPTPSRGKSGTDWLVSRVWTAYTKTWLQSQYATEFERAPAGGAVLWRTSSEDGPPLIALRWKWDHNKVSSQFPHGNFRRVLEVEAESGLAIVQTRAHGPGFATQADESIAQMRRAWSQHRTDDRAVGVIEIRRVYDSRDCVGFLASFHALWTDGTEHLADYSYR